MSEKKVQSTEEKKEKVVTKYDLKMQRRAEEKAKAKKDGRASIVAGILIVVALFCFVISFPIRNWLFINGTYIQVGDEKISRVEFDYNYNVVMNNYLNENALYLSYMGVDFTKDLSTQMYTEDLSFKDFFEELTVRAIIQNKSLKAQADAAGFTHDTSAEYAEYIENIKAAAKEAGVSTSEFVKNSFGTYAKLSRLKKFINDGFVVAAYYDSVAESKTATDAEIQAYYEENKDSYDAVDYRLTTVYAELPTEPTELADPVDETKEAATTEGAATTTETYEPSEAEIEAAMKEAKAEADEKLKTIEKDGTLQENVLRSETAILLGSWLFDAERKAGDNTVIEDASNNFYYVVAFEDRYLDESATVDVRAVILENPTEEAAEATVTGDAVLAEWKGGAATEESFAEIADKYNEEGVMDAEGGLIEAMDTRSLDPDMIDWLNDEARVAGDTTVFAPEYDMYTYVLYYAGQNEKAWVLDARNKLVAEQMEAYLEEIAVGYEVSDPDNNLYYLQVQAAKAAAESAGAESSAEGDTAESTAQSSAQ